MHDRQRTRLHAAGVDLQRAELARAAAMDEIKHAIEEVDGDCSVDEAAAVAQVSSLAVYALMAGRH